jgi:hypothetical protein
MCTQELTRTSEVASRGTTPAQESAPDELRVSCLLWDPSGDDIPDTSLTSETLAIHFETYRDEEETLEKARRSLLPYHTHFLYSLCKTHDHDHVGAEALTAMAAKVSSRKASSRLIACRERISSLEGWSAISYFFHAPNASTSAEVDRIRCWAVALTQTYSSLKSELQVLRAEISFDLAYDRLSLLERRITVLLDDNESEVTQKDASHLGMLYLTLPSSLRPPFISSQTEGKALLRLTSQSNGDASDAMNIMRDMDLPCYDCFVPLVAGARDRLCKLFKRLGVLSPDGHLPTSLSDSSLTPADEELGHETEKENGGDRKERKGEELEGLTDLPDDTDVDTAIPLSTKKHASKKRKPRTREQSKLHKRPRLVSEEPTSTVSAVQVYDRLLSSHEVRLMSTNVQRLISPV